MVQASDFIGLITSEHQNSPKFIQTVSVSVQAFIDQINLATTAYEFYDLDNAVGAQLDAVGLWVGISRYVALSVEQFFSWDTIGLGWDQGIWFQVGDAESQVTTLEDSDYRQVIRAKILCNRWDGSLPMAIEIIQTAVGSTTAPIKAYEQDMAVQFTVTATVSRVLQDVLEGGYLPIKPVGIDIGFYFIPQFVNDNDFGGDVI
ncbi:DUF2612 domain-containing protein [Brytella acorum]|uniref:DUF2612 domain-containing protein n=1 Tax=Brytella acorum TaxID=2959299 RepID=A0AA35XV99_9PROT|nr:DUF2612 domain-containing protein [Brytella acorum]CAI9119535.1 DUF2612 domain-containing protein [Brytella acorum]